MASRRLVHRYAISDIPSEVFTVRFSNDSTLIATGCNDGNVRVYASGKGSLVYTLPPGIPDAMPVTALRFRPAAASKTKNVLLACSTWCRGSFCSAAISGLRIVATRFPPPYAAAGGQVFHWHVTSGKCISRVTEVDNQVFCADYRNDGLVFATAGKQTCVRVYDEGTRTGERS
jgi:COMPASS component SWD3